MRALATQQEGWWLLEAPEVHLRTEAQDLATATMMLADMVALFGDLDPAAVRLDVQVRPGGAGASAG